MIKKYPMYTRFMLFLLFPLLIVAISLHQEAKKSLPQIQGIKVVAGLQNEVEIIRSQHGVPFISAKSDLDAFFSLGYLHAQDRLWQMEYRRRLGKGELSEILGEKALATDQLMRTLGLYRAAEQAFTSLSDPDKTVLNVYADGVNAFLNDCNRLPLEFLILGFKPKKWTPQDSLLQVKLMALNLDGNYNDELNFALLVKELGYDKASELMVGYPKDGLRVTGISNEVTQQNLYVFLEHDKKIRDQFHWSKEGLGSNAWVVSGEHTVNGRPILANDPHLFNEIPSNWYLASLSGGQLDVSGATLPGLPMVIIGHNNYLSWGNTSLSADVQDLYFERLNPLDENQYEVDGIWQKMELREEIINVKSKFPSDLTEKIPPVKWTVRSTRNGPVLSDVVGRFSEPFSLKWTALQEKDTSFSSFLKINYARDWQQFRMALQDHVSPVLNFVYADVDGNIGYTAAGKLPIRANGNGRLPVAGWNSAFNWQSFVPFDKMPYVLNPESGIVVSANNKIHQDDYPYVVSNSWAPPYRAERILEVIETKIQSNVKLTVQDFIDLQSDTYSLQAKQMLPFLNTLSPTTPREAEALALFSAWDGELAADSEAALTYQVWLRRFNSLILKDDLKGELVHVERSDKLQSLLNVVHAVFIDKVVNQKDHQYAWCDQLHTEQVESCEALALIALDAALDEIDRAGAKGKGWGSIHKAKYPHPVFSNVQFLDRIFDREVESGGDGFTVNMGAWIYSEEDEYSQVFGPSYRQVIELGDWTSGGFISNTGQSGNILSEYYDDLLSIYNEMQLLPMTRKQLSNGQGGETLYLKPAKIKENSVGNE
uniref:Penicillin acylase n=1 Tax=Rheinheimera sp. BAL341 TaxID=1708203 RepID=A0A486XP69_9GAMM